MQLLTSKVSADYYTRPPGILSLVILTITYIQAIARVGETTIQHVACTGSMVTVASVVGVMKMGNTTPRVGLEGTSLSVCYHFTT